MEVNCIYKMTRNIGDEIQTTNTIIANYNVNLIADGTDSGRTRPVSKPDNGRR